MAVSVAVVGAGPHIRAKMTLEFLPVFRERLRAFGASVPLFSFAEFAREPGRHRAAIFVWSEDRLDLATRELVARAGFVAGVGGTPVINSHSLGMLIADKAKANQALTRAGVPMPQMIAGTIAPVRVFSNGRLGTHVPTQVIDPGSPLDPGRYNTEWIDTRHEYAGRDYYVSLRAMAVGRRCVSIFVRARPVEDGDASVHATDMPLDAGMWNSFYERLVIPNRGAIETLCRHIAEALGLGFYAHDLLLDRTSGRILVSETNFKFDDAIYKQLFAPLRGQLLADESLTTECAVLSAQAFWDEIGGAGATSPTFTKQNTHTQVTVEYSRGLQSLGHWGARHRL